MKKHGSENKRGVYLLLGLIITLPFFLLLGREIAWGQTIGYFDTLYVDGSGYMFTILMQFPNSALRVFAINRSTEIEGSVTTSALTIEIMAGWLVRFLGVIFTVVLVAADYGDSQSPMLISLAMVVFALFLLFILVRNLERIRPYLVRGLTHLPRISAERAERLTITITNILEHIASIRRFGIATVLTILIWIFGLLFYLYSFNSMNVELTKPHLFVALAAMIVAPPTSPMMIGVFHGAVIAILGTFGLMEADSAAAYAILLHLTQMILLVTLGVIGMRRLDLKFGSIIKEVRANTSKQR